MVKGLNRMGSPFRFLRTRERYCLIYERIWLRHVPEALLVNNEVRPQRIQQNEKVVATKLYGGRRQKDDGFGMVTEEPHRLMAEGVLISDVVRLVYNDEIKARW